MVPIMTLVMTFIGANDLMMGNEEEDEEEEEDDDDG